jgi:dihydrodiol dehydrogenase / D-xylose 1-dehydrogenase (NADP)
LEISRESITMYREVKHQKLVKKVLDMTNIVRWGILGPGGIAHKFVRGLKWLPDAAVTAVGSRSLERAAAFAGQYDIPGIYGCYEDLARDPNVDIIYVATPHPAHKDNCLSCLRAGKAVLCEKPFTMNAPEAGEVIQVARGANLFLMEAMWTRYLPAVIKARELLADGAIGEVWQVRADFGFRSDLDPQGRLLNPLLGGGALLDVGIYPISFASMIFGPRPSAVASLPYIGPTGVDEQFSAVFGYEGGKLATLSAAIRTNTPQDAWIIGTEATLHLPEFWHAQSVRVLREGEAPQVFELPFESTGYNYEAAEAMRCLRAGKLESAIMPLDETLAIMQTMDSIRQTWGLKYPADE